MTYTIPNLRLYPYEEEEDDMSVESRKKILMNRIESLQDELEVLEALPEDDFDEGAVIWFEKHFGGSRTYIYSALKTAGSWWLTGSRPQTRMKWEELIDFIRRHENGSAVEVWVATEWEQVL